MRRGEHTQADSAISAQSRGAGDACGFPQSAGQGPTSPDHPITGGAGPARPRTSSPLASWSTTRQAASPAVTNEPTLFELAARKEYEAALWACFVQLSARRGGITKARKRLQDAMTERLRVEAIFVRLDSRGAPESVHVHAPRMAL